jgi:hypothetical protein
MRHRELKSALLALLRRPEVEDQWERILKLPARQLVNPLFSLLFSGEELVKWRAVTAMGMAVSRLAERDMEAARVIMRRLMWNLNDESGGIGWGSPEAMAEIMARSRPLAAEYACILISYANPEGNFLEHDILQRGVLWGLGRLAEAWPELARPALPYLPGHFSDPDPNLRAMAVWAAGRLADPSLRAAVDGLCDDPEQISLFIDTHLTIQKIGQLARQALARIDAGAGH